jgi:outer membrane protein assembly factor BamB
MGKKYVRSVLAVVLIVSLVLFCNWLFIFTFSTNTACKIGLEWKRHSTEDVHRAQSLDVKVSNLWNMKIAAEDMEIHNEILIITDRNCNEVVAFDLHSGQTIWTRGFGGPRELELDTYRDRVYVTGGWSWQREIMAVDVNTGQEKWLNNSQNFKRVGLGVVSLSDGRVLVTVGDQGPRLVDPDAGRFSDVIALPLKGFFRRDGDYMWAWNNSRLHAVDMIDHKTSWSSSQIDLANALFSNVSHYGDIVIANFGIINHDSPWTSSQLLVGFSFDTGDKLWEAPDLALEYLFEIDLERVYVFDGNNLLLVNALSGDEEGRVTFTGEENIERSKLRNSLFRIHNDIIAIYFADTETLSIYEIDD